MATEVPGDKKLNGRGNLVKCVLYGTKWVARALKMTTKIPSEVK